MFDIITGDELQNVHRSHLEDATSIRLVGQTGTEDFHGSLKSVNSIHSETILNCPLSRVLL